MAVVINGSGTVTGISVGGLPDGIVDRDTLATSIDDSGDATAITIISSEDVGVGVTPETWAGGIKGLQFGNCGAMGSWSGNSVYNNNAYYSSGWKYITTNESTAINHNSAGDILFQTAPSGTADAAITYTTAMTIANDGTVTQPLQPAFGTRITSLMDNLADGYNTITFDSEIFDQNSDFNTGTYTFTAPVTGKYMLSASIASINLPLDAQWFFLQILTSNRSYTHSTSTDQFDAAADASHVTSYTMSSLADMDAGDTAYVRAYQYTGTNQTDINDNYSFFNGYLVC